MNNSVETDNYQIPKYAGMNCHTRAMSPRLILSVSSFQKKQTWQMAERLHIHGDEPAATVFQRTGPDS